MFGVKVKVSCQKSRNVFMWFNIETVSFFCWRKCDEFEKYNKLRPALLLTISKMDFMFSFFSLFETINKISRQCRSKSICCNGFSHIRRYELIDGKWQKKNLRETSPLGWLTFPRTGSNNTLIPLRQLLSFLYYHFHLKLEWPTTSICSNGKSFRRSCGIEMHLENATTVKRITNYRCFRPKTNRWHKRINVLQKNFR